MQLCPKSKQREVPAWESDAQPNTFSCARTLLFLRWWTWSLFGPDLIVHGGSQSWPQVRRHLQAGHALTWRAFWTGCGRNCQMLWIGRLS